MTTDFLHPLILVKKINVSLQLLSETFLVLRSQRDIINVHRSSRKLPIIILRF
jgi:hypothetical protein